MRLLNCLNPFGIGKLECILSTITNITKTHATNRIYLHKKQNDILSLLKSIQSFHSYSIVDFFPIHYPIIFCQFIPVPSILSICLPLLQKITNFLLQNNFFYYYLVRCEQMLPFAKLFSKKVDISKTKKLKTLSFHD